VRTDPMSVAAGPRALAAAPPVVVAVNDLGQVIAGLQAWVMGLLAAVATLFLVIGGLRYVLAAGDPSEIERAKGALKSAAVGYALAVLAPVLMAALRGILGV
jgi:succinate dehydrogenase hydrophobic anchor subunit